MGKYALGSWGASSAKVGRQRLNGVGTAGGNVDSEKTLRLDVMLEMAAVRSRTFLGTAGTTGLSAASLEGVEML